MVQLRPEDEETRSGKVSGRTGRGTTGVVENLEAGPQILLRCSEEPVCGGWQLGRQTQTPSLQTKAKASMSPESERGQCEAPAPAGRERLDRLKQEPLPMTLRGTEPLEGSSMSALWSEQPLFIPILRPGNLQAVRPAICRVPP